MNGNRGSDMSGLGGPQPSGPSGHGSFAPGPGGQTPTSGQPTFGPQQPPGNQPAWTGQPGYGGQPPFGGQPPYPGQPGFGGPPPQQAPKSSKTLVIVLIAIVGVLVLAVIGVFAAVLIAGSSSAATAYEKCSELVPESTAATLSADKQSIFYSSGSTPYSEDFQMLDCLLETTGAPSAVDSRMGHTRALDGTQDAEWDGWSAFWTYHPDAGLDVTFTAE